MDFQKIENISEKTEYDGFKINQDTDESVPFSCPRLEFQNSDTYNIARN